jgi:hypothetical protein
MPISKELMLAILAMDSYNRGYNSGIVGPNGTAQTGLGLTGQIGLATVQANSSNLDTPGNVGRDQAASFFAISYSFGGNAPAGLANQNVISYRGTDRSRSSSRRFLKAGLRPAPRIEGGGGKPGDDPTSSSLRRFLPVRPSRLAGGEHLRLRRVVVQKRA